MAWISVITIGYASSDIAVKYDSRDLCREILKHCAGSFHRADVDTVRRTLRYSVENETDDILQLFVAESDKNANFRTTFRGQQWSTGDNRVLEFLMIHGFELGAAFIERNSLLPWTLTYANDTLAQLILEREPTIFNTILTDFDETCALESAAKKGRESVIETMLHRVMQTNQDTASGGPLLRLAAIRGNQAMTRLLLQSENIDVNTEDPEFGTPLLIAADKGHTSVVQVLLRHERVNVNYRGWRKTPLGAAIEGGHVPVVRLLLNHADIDVNAFDNSLWTPLMYAAGLERVEVVDLLLERKNLDVNTTTASGICALWWAVERGSADIVEHLLRRSDIDVSLQGFCWDAEPLTPLELARRKEDPLIAKMLEQKIVQQKAEM